MTSSVIRTSIQWKTELPFNGRLNFHSMEDQTSLQAKESDRSGGAFGALGGALVLKSSLGEASMRTDLVEGRTTSRRATWLQLPRFPTPNGNVPAFPQTDFHLWRNENRHFALYLPGCGDFNARRIGEPPISDGSQRGSANATPYALRRSTTENDRVVQPDLKLGRCPRPRTRVNHKRLAGIRGMG